MNGGKFSQSSNNQLSTCHWDLQRLFLNVVCVHDCTIVQGYRGEYDQNQAFNAGASQKQYPDGMHNGRPSLAVDVQPFPYPNKKDVVKAFYLLAGVVFSHAKLLGIRVRWGGDWNSNGIFTDQKFNDLFHWEVVE